MKNFDWNAFGIERNKIAVHCKTEEEAIDFCKQSHDHGYDWWGGESRVDNTNWSEDLFGYGDATCYTTEHFSGIIYYVENDYTILNWSDYMTKSKPIFTKSDLKDGDMVLRRNGVVEVVILSLGVLTGAEGYMLLADTNEDFSDINGEEDWDIIEVRRPKHPYECQFTCFESNLGEVVYNRERDSVPVVEITLEEICEALGKKIKIAEG